MRAKTLMFAALLSIFCMDAVILIPYKQHEGALIGEGRGIIDANWRRLQVGLQYTF